MPPNNTRLIAQLKQRFTSEVLWHFVGRKKSTDEERYDCLLSILQNGLKIGTVNESFKFFDVNTKGMRDLIAYKVSCLADIPLKDLHIHAERYGRFAIGFHKESAIDNHFNPVLYVNQYGYTFQHFIKLRDELEKHFEGDESEIAKKFDDLLVTLGSFVKSGNLKANPINAVEWDDLQVNNFYYEREWRSVYDWDFKSNDVAVIIVPDEYLSKFHEDKKSASLKIDEKVTIMPFSMIYSL